MDVYDWFLAIILVMFYTIFVGKTLWLRAGGINPLVLGAGKKGAAAALEIAFIFAPALWTIEVASNALHSKSHILPEALYTRLPEYALMRTAGTAMILIGFAIFVLSLISFGDSWRIGIDTRSPGGLVKAGVFSLTRNPVFLFIDIYCFGTWLIYPSLFFGGSAIIAIAGCHRQILGEEKFLAERYGKEYEEYRSKVRRYL